MISERTRSTLLQGASKDEDGTIIFVEDGNGSVVFRLFRAGEGTGDQRQLVLPVGDDYFCRSPRVIIRYRRCRIGYRSASRNTEAETNGRKDATDGGGNGGDERALGPQVAVRPVAVGDQD